MSERKKMSEFQVGDQVQEAKRGRGWLRYYGTVTAIRSVRSGIYVDVRWPKHGHSCHFAEDLKPAGTG